MPGAYQVRLSSYNGQPMSMLVWNQRGEGSWSGTLEEANGLVKMMQDQNPGGTYIIEVCPPATTTETRTSWDRLIEDE